MIDQLTLQAAARGNVEAQKRMTVFYLSTPVKNKPTKPRKKRDKSVAFLPSTTNHC